MGFKSVYQMLADVFPQVDTRILKAVAIENSKNAEAAVEIVLSEILPYLSQRAMIENSKNAATSVKEDSKSVLSDGEAEQREPTLRRRRGFNSEKTGMNTAEAIPIGEKDVCGSDVGTSAHRAGKEKMLDQTADLSVDANADRDQLQGSVKSDVDANVDRDQLQGSVESDEVILLEKPQSPFDNIQLGPSESEALSGADVERQVAPLSHEFQDAKTSFEHEVQGVVTSFEHEPAQSDPTNNLMQENGVSSVDHHVEWPDYLGVSSERLTDFLDTSSEQWTDYFGISSGHGLAQSDLTNLIQENDGIHPTVEKTAEEVATTFSPEGATFSPEGAANSENAVSNHVDKIVLLEEAIEDAKNNKKNLFLAMELIMDMMRKVELEEKEAEFVKEEASRGGMDILKKVEDLKPVLEHAKEANNMHAGEVYGEKAILATEVRELQIRLLSLSNERDNGLAILDQMRQTLEERLTMAEELKRLAEEEKQEKEEAALKLLAEQEAIMEKVVQESKILQQEAEENSKLREFLMDRGQVVDTLQGEISVICQDVRLLKEKFDERVPLSQSISSSQTSCILASSGSSLKSITSDRLVDETSKSSKLASAASSVASLSESVDGDSEKRMLDEGSTLSLVGSLTPKKHFEEANVENEELQDGLSPKKHFEGANVDNKELLDDGWEFCE